MYIFTHITIHTNNIISKNKKIIHKISIKHRHTHTHMYIIYIYNKERHSKLKNTHILLLRVENI